MSLADMARRRERHPGEVCRACDNGQWYSECCNGAGGCSCRGDIVPMGRCRVCGGTGVEPDDADLGANVASIEGRPFLGSGPTSGGWW